MARKRGEKARSKGKANKHTLCGKRCLKANPVRMFGKDKPSVLRRKRRLGL